MNATVHMVMPYDAIQGQGRENFKVRNSFHFQSLSPPPFTM